MTDLKNQLIPSNNYQGQFCETDYQIVLRDPQISLKYSFTLQNKQINILKQNQPKDSIHNMPIVCSYADMEFKMSPQIQKQWISRLSTKPLHLGYVLSPSSSRAEIVLRMKLNTGIYFKKSQVLFINSMLTFYHLVLTQLTQKNDQILLFTPTYYRFTYTLQNEGRKIVQYQLNTRQDQSGETQFFIDFEDLQRIFSQNQIKMIVFANPHNPTGKIWSKQEMSQLKHLCLKYNCLIFSDDIFCQCIDYPIKKYTSFLQFPQVHKSLIWAGSFGKAFNCSSNSFTYSIVQNPQIRQKLSDLIMKINLYPTFAAFQLLESCYKVGETWKLNTIKYIQDNYDLMKMQFKKRFMKINCYKLESAFLPILDFAAYKWSQSQLKKRLEKFNIFPTYLESCYVKRQKQSISCVRFNIAMNRQILRQLIDRLEKALIN